MSFSPYSQFVLCVILAATPVAVWGYVFFRKWPSNRYLAVVTFLVGGLSVFPILFYKSLWNWFPWMNAFLYAEKFSNYSLSIGALITVPLSVLITFMLVGVIEEWTKHYTVRIVDNESIHTIDDAIILSIVAALGFAFVENILYFYDIWLAQGGEGLILPFIFRSIFSTFAHVMFSGIFGYFYGIAHFASPVFQEEIRNNRHPALKLMHRIFRFKTADLFYKEKILEGLLIASLLHAIFNVALELNMAFVLVPYLTLGYLTLDHLLKRKENHHRYNKLSAEKNPIK